MQRVLIRNILIFLLFFAPVIGKAQAGKTKSVVGVVRIDTNSQVTPAKFDKEAISNYKAQKEFQYDEIGQQQLSWWDRFWLWFWQMVGDLFQGAAGNPISRYIFIGVGVGVVIFIVLKLIGSENIFSRKSKETILPYDVLTENIHEIDYEQELQRLITEGKFRLAVRLLYLRALKKLSDAELIQWQPEKTNYHYLTELREPALKNDFGKLTLQFDYIWYGDFPIDATRFEPINQSFNHFNSQIR
ncbi:DUF4129 domain-containing protein [Pedobacter sp. HDW13]|uniref:DUF4129 domain-containing protein n=1 Tax=unclassified Pedobacter TaxID=2628915 RepID=UPI000F5B68E4|nr:MULTISPECIES: DUF4129 domain-containing protein [unclassified Pedobacter]QIL39686.1 DUF4129 domain-containing protein [Pedobacter sp. HDW13]RQO79834.1 hypothetical protein DBR40_02435 [Pedobacter sp. KBW01]